MQSAAPSWTRRPAAVVVVVSICAPWPASTRRLTPRPSPLVRRGCVDPRRAGRRRLAQSPRWSHATPRAVAVEDDAVAKLFGGKMGGCKNSGRSRPRWCRMPPTCAGSPREEKRGLPPTMACHGGGGRRRNHDSHRKFAWLGDSHVHRRSPRGGAVPEDHPAAVEAALGLDREARRAIQRGLLAEGVDPGVVDGLFGPNTRGAIRQWQAERGALVTGYLDRAAAEALRAAASSITGTNLTAAQPSTSAQVEAHRTPQEEAATRRPQAGQLPPEIVADRYLLQAERLIAEQDYSAALDRMSRAYGARKPSRPG